VSPRTEDGATEGGYSIRAVQRVCDLLDLLQREPEGISLGTAAEVTGLPKSSAFRYLFTLEERRYVERDPAGGDYLLGPALLTMQSRQMALITQRARGHLERLQAEFGETANLGRLDGRRIVYLEIVESTHAMRLAARPGDRDLLHCTALGKAIAAHLPVDRVREILKSEGMERRTERTLTTQRDFFTQLEKVRQDGFAVDDGENEVGARCVAVALPNLPVAVSVSGPAARLKEELVETVAQRLQETAAALVGELIADAVPSSAT
jgi:IclR family acetate operon transcriptional repressor